MIKCTRCLNQYRIHKIPYSDISPAEYVYNGRSLCLQHLNEAQGYSQEAL